MFELFLRPENLPRFVVLAGPNDGTNLDLHRWLAFILRRSVWVVFTIMIGHNGFGRTVSCKIRIHIVNHLPLCGRVSYNRLEIHKETAESGNNDSCICDRSLLGRFDRYGIPLFVDLNDVRDNLVLCSHPHHRPAESKAEKDKQNGNLPPPGHILHGRAISVSIFRPRYSVWIVLSQSFFLCHRILVLLAFPHSLGNLFWSV